MTNSVEVKILVILKQDIAKMEKEIAHGNFASIADFYRLQGQLFGLEKALSLTHDIIAEREDRLENR